MFDNAWSASGAAVCNTIKGYLLDALGSFEEWTCSLPSNGDLLGGLAGPNELGLKYQVNGISIGLDYEKDGDWANINGTFDAQLAITLGVASSINGSVTSSSSPYGTTPVSINSSQVSFSDADFSSANVLLHIFAPNALPQAQSELDSTVLKGVASLLRLTSDVTTINSDLHTAASWIASLYVLSSDPEATQMFSLSLGVDAQHVTFTLGRGGSPEPQPSGCNYYPDDTYPGYTEVDAICSPDQPRGVTQLQLQELTSGSWRDDPADTTFEPGAPGGPESSWLAPPPYVDWSPNNGPDSGYVPLMTDYPSTQWVRPGVPSATVQMRVCSTNKWGLNCDAPVAVAQNQQLASTGGGSGGGGRRIRRRWWWLQPTCDALPASRHQKALRGAGRLLRRVGRTGQWPTAPSEHPTLVGGGFRPPADRRVARLPRCPCLEVPVQTRPRPARPPAWARSGSEPGR